MSDDKTPGFLDEQLLSQPDTPPASAPAEPPKAAEPPKTEPAAPPAAPPVNHTGPVTPPTTTTVAPGQPPTQPEPHMVPLATVLDTRDKLKETQADRDRLQRELEAARRQSQPQGPKPSELMFTDPDAYDEYVMERATRVVRTQILEANLNAAETRHGQAFKDAYEAVLKAGPHVVQECLAKPDPGEAIVNWHKRNKTLTSLPDTFFVDPDAWARQRYAELAAQAAQPAPGIPPAQPGAAPMAAPTAPAALAAPPPSLAAAPGSAGAFQEQVPESAFAYAFGG